MTGPDHYREAERLIKETGPEHSDDALLEIHAHTILAKAQVHATLALAAAMAGGLGDAFDVATATEQWREVTR